MATRYVNADSNGAANNPTRSFDDPAYSANDSYRTFQAAYTFAEAGDVIEFSGGASGKTYAGLSDSILLANLTIQGSAIPGFNGPVTVANAGGKQYAMGPNAAGITIQNLKVANGEAGWTFCIRIFQNNVTLRNVSIANSAGGGIAIEPCLSGIVIRECTFDLGSLARLALQTASAVTVTNCIFAGITYSLTKVTPVYLLANAPGVVVNNCLFSMSGNQSTTDFASITAESGAGGTFNNCIIVKSGLSEDPPFYFAGNGTIITNNCFIAASRDGVCLFASGTGSWRSNNDVLNQFPCFMRTAENMGFMSFSTDDRVNIPYFAQIAGYAMQNYGIPMSMFVSDTLNLTADDITTLQTLYKAGHDIGSHTRDHNDMSVLNGLLVTYGGSNSVSLVIADNGSSLSITGTGDTHGPVSLATAPNNTLSGLAATISGWPHFACVLPGRINPATPSNTLKDAIAALIPNIEAAIPFDDRSTADNRYLSHEILGSINDLEAAMHSDVTCASYRCKVHVFPYDNATTLALNWVKNHTDLLGIRNNYSAESNSILECCLLRSINVYNISNWNMVTADMRGADYNMLTTAQKRDRIQQAGRIMAMYASNGVYAGMLNHNEWADLTIQEFEWLLDEVQKYRALWHISIDSFGNLISTIRTSGLWTDSGPSTFGGEIWTRTFSGAADFRPLPQSPLVNAGTAVSGRTADLLGNPVAGTPDIGPYELPASPSGACGSFSPLTLSISWDAVTNAVSYGIEIATDAGFSTLIFSQTGLTGTSAQVSLTQAVNYYIHINANGSSGTSPWCGTLVMSVPTINGYATGNATYYRSVFIPANAPTCTWGSPAGTFSVSPALPAGLSIDQTTGIISGAPATGLSATEFTITLSNGAIATTGITIQVKSGTTGMVSGPAGGPSGQVPTAQSIGNLICGTNEKPTPADDDELALMDSAAGSILRRLSWSNIKAKLRTYFDAIYQPVLTETAVRGFLGISAERDSGNSGATLTINWTTYRYQKITLTANCTLNAYAAPPSPCTLLLKVVQNGTTAYTLTFNAATCCANGKSSGGLAVSGTLSSVNLYSIYYDGTNYHTSLLANSAA